MVHQCSPGYKFGPTNTRAHHLLTIPLMSETSLNSDFSDKNSTGVTKKQMLIIVGSSLIAIVLIVGVLFAKGVFEAKKEPENNTSAVQNPENE